MTAFLTALSSPEFWAAEVGARAELPDERLNQRLAQILATFAQKPLDSIPQAAPTAGAAKAIYRFLDNERVRVDDLLQAVVRTTVESCRGQPRILAIQDSSSVNFSTLRCTTGLGPLNDSAHARGLHVHTTLAVREDGLALGLLHQQCWSRPDEKRTAEDRYQRPFEAKESVKWWHGLVAAEAAVAELPAAERPRLVHIMDREGDIHEIIQEISARQQGAVIRCVQNRQVAGPIATAHEAVAAAPLRGQITLEVPAQHGQPRRRATLELRAVTLTILPSRKHKHHRRRRPVTWNLVEVRERDVPANGTPLHWFLWTTEPIDTLADLREIVRLYKLRWRIEDFHLTLKSGCRTEALELETADRLTKALTLYSAVAARIVALRDLARQEPDAPCTLILSTDAWHALWIQIHKKPLTATTPVPTVRQAILWIGRLGGHLNRKRDGLPGVRTLWRGWRDLTVLVAGYRLARHFA